MTGAGGLRTLVVNAGSSSLKLTVVGAAGAVEAVAESGPPDEGMLDRMADFARQVGRVDAVGHRVVHGGSRFLAPTVVDTDVRRRLETVSELAPLHNPPALAGIDAARTILADAPSVACFDTAFHASIPVAATAYAIPREWSRRGIRRYGFHGLSCAWAVRRCRDLLPPRKSEGRLVICHLGSGASVTAVAGGRSIDTTMGFTPLEGLVMSTRCGDVDPGAILRMLREGLDVDAIAADLERRSGLLGLAGTADMREVLLRRAAGDERALRALEVYVHRLRAKIAAMAAAASGVDAVVFTGGVGEHAPDIRAETAAGLQWIGLTLDEAANATATQGDAVISAGASAVTAVVLEAREDLEIARQCALLVAPEGAHPSHHPKSKEAVR